MNTKKIFVIALVCVAAVGGGIWIFSGYMQTANTNSESCVQTKSCLPSHHNTLNCESLHVGVSERDLIYLLGQPVESEVGVLYFEAGAAEEGPIEIELDEARKAKKIYCHGRG